jgi:copper transport protein
MAAIWVGALIPLRTALGRGEQPSTATLFSRFQTVGGLAVAGVLTSGFVMAWLLLPHLSDLWRSDYGRRLVCKLSAVGIMVAIAVMNRQWFTRHALADVPRMRERLRLVLALDTVVAMIATVLAVGLSFDAPPRSDMRVLLDDRRYSVELEISPGRIADNDILIHLHPKPGQPPEPKEVEIRLSTGEIEPIVLKAARIGPSLFQVKALPLWTSGPWHVRVNLLVDDYTKVEVEGEVVLPP